MGFKSVGILTSGGDCPGLNALVVSAYRALKKRSVRLVGIKGGFRGLLDSDTEEINDRHIFWATKGGSFLGTSRGDGGLKEKLHQSDFTVLLEKNELDALMVAGGEGSLSALIGAAEMGLPVVGIPATIDNDIKGSEYSLGFDSACNKVIRAADEIADTGSSLHGRIFLLVTLGGDTGHIALASAKALGADAVIIPEIAPDLIHVGNKIKKSMDNGKPYSIVIVSEGVKDIAGLEKSLVEITGYRIRTTSLGHAQRGGASTFYDMQCATRFADEAVELLLKSIFGRFTAIVKGKITSVAISLENLKRKEPDLATYQYINE